MGQLELSYKSNGRVMLRGPCGRGQGNRRRANIARIPTALRPPFGTVIAQRLRVADGWKKCCLGAKPPKRRLDLGLLDRRMAV